MCLAIALVPLLCSLLQQLQGELQSGTFDLKAMGPLTDTITLDAAALVQQQVASTPAPSTGLGLKAGPYSALNSSKRGPSVLATAVQPRAAGMASCLKAPAAAGPPAAAAQHEHHAARAVTFAADVHDNGVDVAGHGHAHRAGQLWCGGQQALLLLAVAVPCCPCLLLS